MGRIDQIRREGQDVRLATSNNNALRIPNNLINGLNPTTSLCLETGFLASDTSVGYLMGKYNFTGNQRQYSLVYSGSTNRIVFNVSGDGLSGGQFMQFRMDVVIVPNKRYYISAQFDTVTDTCEFLLDGYRQRSTTTIAGNVLSPMQAFDVDFTIGCTNNNNAYNNFFNGQLWDARVWTDNIRTEEKIRDNIMQIADADKTGLVGRWLASRVDFKDESGNGNDLIAIGTPIVTSFARVDSDRTDDTSDRILIT